MGTHRGPAALSSVTETMTAPAAVPRPALDAESVEWLRLLATDATEGHRRLHGLLLRVARAEAVRRRSGIPERGREEVDDLCVQAANDALMAILRKLPEYQGRARFTTWACKFAIFEVSTRLRRHSWRYRRTDGDEAVLAALPAGSPSALARLEQSELLVRLGRLVEERLTEHQRRIFMAAAVEEVPIDVLADQLGSTRGAIYKTLHDARGKLRRALADHGFGEVVR